jgi:hypothetical protein
MSDNATLTEHTIDSILEQLDRFHQRVTYGAVASVVNASPRSLMSGRPRNSQSSWIVSRKDGQPSGYHPDQKHPELESRDQILRTADELRSWLDNPA